MTTRKDRVPWNLSVNSELKRLMKIQCASDGDDISEVTEKLYRDYLKQNKVSIRAAEEKEPHNSAQHPRKRVRYSGSKRRAR